MSSRSLLISFPLLPPSYCGLTSDHGGAVFSSLFHDIFIFPLQGTLGFICLSRCDRAEPPAAGPLGGAAAPAARGEPSGEEDIERGITHLQQAPSRPPCRSPNCDPQSFTIFHYLPLSSTIFHYPVKHRYGRRTRWRNGRRGGAD